MVYAYKCSKCGRNFDIVKSVKDIDLAETCPSCESPAIRDFAPKKIHLSKTKVTHAEFNPGLGKVVKNEHHKKELCKQLGVTEIGNDYGSGDKMQTAFEQARETKKNIEWEKL